MTRDEMMELNSIVDDTFALHNEYYAQFVTQATQDFVISRIGIEKIKKSKDKHLNDVCKMSNYGAGNWTWDFAPINLTLARELGEVGKNSLPSPSTCTCVSKVAARMLLDDINK